MFRNRKIALVIPCLNEENGLKFVLSGKPEFLDLVIVVDNGSTDSSAATAASYGALVVREAGPGYGRAYMKGFASLPDDIDIVVTMDGDGSYCFDNLPLMLNEIVAGKDFVSGTRFLLKNKSAMSFVNIIGNGLLSVVMSLLLKRIIRDSQSGMWVFKKKVLDGLSLKSLGMSFSQEIKMEVIFGGYAFTEVWVPYCDRLGNTKLKKWKDGWFNLCHLFSNGLGRSR